jgi:hypothetical protein
MLPFDNNMMLMIAIALVIAAVAYMYRDLEKTKSELSSFKNSLRPQHPPTTGQAPSAAAPVKREAEEKAIAEDEVSD